MVKFLIKFHDSRAMYYIVNGTGIILSTSIALVSLAISALLPIVFSVICMGVVWRLTPDLKYSKDEDKVSNAVFVIVTVIHVPIWLVVMYYLTTLPI